MGKIKKKDLLNRIAIIENNIVDIYQTLEYLDNKFKQCNANYNHVYNCLCSEITKREEQRPISKEKMEEVINELGTSKIDI